MEIMWANPHSLCGKDDKLLLIGQENNLDLSSLVRELRHWDNEFPFAIQSITLNKDELMALDVCGFKVKEKEDGTYCVSWNHFNRRPLTKETHFSKVI